MHQCEGGLTCLTMIVPGPDGKGGVGDDDGGCTNDGTFNGFSVGGNDLGDGDGSGVGDIALKIIVVLAM